jgi:glycosyltransferase involved in cell wall biosynthesis
MRIVFVHPNYPAQFGHVARWLHRRHGDECLFVCNKEVPPQPFVRVIPYRLRGGATEKTHYCSRTFENAVWHAHAAYEALAAAGDLKPDLVVGHSGFGTTLFVPELFRCPVVNYFEFFYHSRDSDLDFLPDAPPPPIDRLRARARNAMILLDLNTCAAGYSPTRFQHSLLPAEYRDKVEVIFDGVDLELWRAGPEANRRFGDWEVPAGCKLVTYATRGMERMRGFDVFMKAALEVSRRRPDVVFAIAGQDRVCYGGDGKQAGRTLKEQLLASGDYDPARFRFLGLLPPLDLARLFRLSDLHVYLTVPFVLSWSLFDALACGATVLASDTAPVRELVAHGANGLLADFFDADGFVRQALAVLERPAEFRHLGAAGRRLVEERYSTEVCLPRIRALYERAASGG